MSQSQQIAILGSTGSIGTQTLQVVAQYPERFVVRSISSNTNAELLIRQAIENDVARVAVGDESTYRTVRDALAPRGVEVLSGEHGLSALSSDPDVDVVVGAIVGYAGLRPVLDAVRAGHRVALANKEALVVAGHLVRQSLGSGGELIPVDSEHSAIFQCIQGEAGESVDGIVLTASGGPFREREIHTFDEITKAEALAHPNWEMGAKITIDSATMMNKGLEVIEAFWLFGVGVDSISVVVHPQSIVHSMVNFRDGSTKAQLGLPDMRVPIQYALTYPDRWPSEVPAVAWSDYPMLTFEAPDKRRFPCLGIAFDALRAGGSAPAVLNAANEVAVRLFLEDRIGFTGIAILVESVLAAVGHVNEPGIDDLADIDREARARALELASYTAHST
ncbi:MAG: 1-deoxy-D-xylulose-5-phosphate reductoisomerase [Bacteroidetes bacterium]|nr:1-deoxy-D-xylulose-5-phosphate reductoisomerase [Bacteroidota bacterium]